LDSVKVSGLGNFIRAGADFADNTDIPIPVVQITTDEANQLVDWMANSTVIVQIDELDFNSWGDMYQSPLQWIYFSIVMGALSVFLVVYGSWKWYWFIRIQGWGFTVPNIILPVEVIANFRSLLFFSFAFSWLT